MPATVNANKTKRVDMIPDFIKIECEGVNEALKRHRSLHWQVGVDIATGELINDVYGRVWRSAKYGSLFFYEITSQNKTVYRVEGSIHKHALNGYNYKDLSFERFVKTIRKLIETFETDFGKWKLLPFEFGLNLNLTFKVSKLLNSLLNCKGKEYSMEDNNRLCHFDLSHYKLKIYDKGYLAGIDGNILRIEIHMKKMQFLNKKKVVFNTLSDLLKKENIERLSKVLLSVWRNVIVDEFGAFTGQLTASDSVFVNTYSNPREWKKIKGNKRQDVKKRYKKLVTSKLGKQSLHATILRSLQNKATELLNQKSPFVTSVKSNEDSPFVTIGAMNRSPICYPYTIQ